MNPNIEKKLKQIVETSTKKTAIEEWRTAAEKQRVPLYNYRLDHIEEVVDLAKEIASGTEANMEVVVLAAWLHDLAKPGIGGISAKHHGIASAELAEEILTEEKVSPEIINQVTDVIRKHVGLTISEPLKAIEAQVLWEADKILKLGMVGLIQGILNGVRLFPGRSLFEMGNNLLEFLPLASDIVKCIVTERGREVAEERLNTFKELTKSLQNEINLGKQGE
ncbi:MAG: hypothetical protein AM326_10670 [Candidatus Thorarchaeota archaeon SMTZ-45]|nr:MAG: hypothetical protein AM326_10670 [Candidatus Thorarchaeota archaeon SMTZ-45]